MDTKRFTVGTVVGAAVLYGTGWLIFNKAFGAYYAANGGSATGVDRTPQIIWALVVANVAYAALICFAMGNRSESGSPMGAMKIGAVVGFLAWACADFVFYGSTNIANLNRTMLDPFLEIVHGGSGGLAIGFALKSMSARTPARSPAAA